MDTCSIKGEVKDIFSLDRRGGSSPRFPAPSPIRIFSGIGAFPSQRFTLLAATASSDSETHKRCGCVVATMVLSETRGLMLFRVIRGGIGFTQRLGAHRTACLQGIRILTLDPERRENRLAHRQPTVQRKMEGALERRRSGRL